MQVNTEKTELALKTASSEVSLFVEDAQKEVEALEAHYKSLVPDASTKAGYDDCKAVRRDLMPIKSSLEKARQTLKAPILEAGRLVDSTMKPLAERVEALYKPFEAAYRAVDEEKKMREQRRQEAIEAGFQEIQNAIVTASGSTSSVIQVVIDDLADFSIDPEIFMERTDEAAKAHSDAMSKLGDMLIQAVNFEEMQAKQKEIEERERAIREKEMAEEAKQREAELKAFEEQRRKELEQAREEARAKAEQEAKERHKLELEQAEKRAKEAEQLAIQRERERLDQERAEAKRQEEIREADKKHKASIHNGIIEVIIETGITKEQAKSIVTLIAKRKVPSLNITY